MGDKLADYWRIYTETIDKFEQAGDHAEAAHCAEQLVRHFPSAPIAWTRYAAAQLKNERPEEADAAFERALAIDPLHPDTVFAYASRLRAKKEYQRALALLEPLLGKHTYWEAGHALHCELRIDCGDLNAARRAAENFLAAEPSAYSLRLALLKALILGGDVTAPVQLALAAESAAGEAERLEQLAALLAETGRYHEALETIRKLGPRISGQAVETYMTGLEGMGEPARALALAERVLKSAPSDVIGARARKLARALHPRGSEAVRSKTVLFVTTLPRIREAKFAHALRLQGWDAILLYKYDPNYDPARYFSEAIRFTTVDDALGIADRLGIAIHHVCSLRGDIATGAFIREKLAFTIFDLVDVYDSVMYHDFEFHGLQRYCLTAADALVCRDLNIRLAAKLGGYSLPQRLLHFPEYCWAAPQHVNERGPSKELHVVQSGWIDIERFTGVKSGNCLAIVEALVRDGIHVHIYQHLLAKAKPLEVVYEDFLALGKETGLVHVHENMPLHDVVDELKRYDVGMFTMLDPDEPETKTFPRTMNPVLLRGGITARCTDYIEAGLAVITSTVLRHQCWVNARYGTNIELTPELLKQPRKTLSPYCTDQARAARCKRGARFTLAAHAPRLVQFYERCLADKKRT